MELYKLGKQPAKHDLRTLFFENYYAFPTSPKERIWSDKVKDYPMMKNDVMGNCAIVSPAHQIQTWTANVGNEVILTDDEVVQIYSTLSGYNPKTGENDHGCVLLDVLKYWRNVGFCGHKIGAFMAVNPRNIEMVKTAINLFGGMINGIALPISAQGKDFWDIEQSFNGDGQPGSWGGHCTISPDYNEKENINITWGTHLPATWSFMQVYADEMYAILSPDFISNGIAPNGFNLAQLQTDLANIK